MAYDNKVYQWEGDSTQAFDTMYWESPEVVTDGRIRMSCARVLFDVGDLEAFWNTLEAREELIRRNSAKLATGLLGTTGGDEGGYIFGQYPLAGDNLEAVPALPSYGGSLSLIFRLYADGVLKFTKTLYTNKIFKLAGGYGNDISFILSRIMLHRTGHICNFWDVSQFYEQFYLFGTLTPLSPWNSDFVVGFFILEIIPK